MFTNLQALFTQKTCPDPYRVFDTLAMAETRLQGENKGMVYPAVLEGAYHRVCGELRLGYDPGEFGKGGGAGANGERRGGRNNGRGRTGQSRKGRGFQGSGLETVTRKPA
jgi:hypothetical protein